MDPRSPDPHTASERCRALAATMAKMALVKVALAVVLVALLAAVSVLAEPALAQEDGGQSMDLVGAADQLVIIAAAVIVAIIFLRAIPDLGKRAYASLGILIVVGGIVYYLAQNPDSLTAIGRFFAELLSLVGGGGGGGQ